MNFIKRLFCKHKDSKTITNVYGDYINYISNRRHIYRSIKSCNCCGKIFFSEYLDEDCNVANYMIQE